MADSMVSSDKTFWKFEAERGRWFSITDDYNRPSARAHHVAALDAMNGVIWIHGGYDESALSCRETSSFGL